MSLFGGDSAPTSARQSAPSSSPGFPSEHDFSDFSIEEIRRPSPAGIRRVSFSSQSHQYFKDAQHSNADYQPQDSNDEAQDYDDDDDDEEEAEYEDEDEEASRSRIKARTWRHYTAADRDIYTSLLALRSQDLSAHLFNTHALKVRLRTPTAVANTTPYARKLDWIPKDEERGKRPWVPETAWTAWPLEPENVPKPDTFADTWGSRVYDDPGRGRGRGKISRDLQEELSAVFLRQAKDMWLRRQPGRPAVAESRKNAVTKSDRRSLGRGPSTEREVAGQTVGMLAGQDGHDLESDYAPSPRRSRRSSTASQHYNLDSSLVEVAGPTSGQQSPSPLPPSSPPIIRHATPTSVKEEDLKQEEDDVQLLPARPVFSADDDRSYNLLAPTVRHVISKLDDLLLALHHQREGQYRGRHDGDSSDNSARSISTSASRRSRSAQSQPQSAAKSRQRASTPAASRIRTARSGSNASSTATPKKDQDGDAATRDADDDEDVYRRISSDSSDLSDTAAKSPRKRPTKREKSVRSASPVSPGRDTHKKDPRDWSAVLGVAALNGWDSAVIARAAKRCESLFGETMLFRTLPELGPAVEEHNAGSRLNEGETSDDADWEQGHHTNTVAFPCPFPMCKRHSHPFDRGWRWRDHLKRRHGQSPEQTASYESTIVIRSAVTSTNTNASNKHSKRGRFRQNVLDYNPMHWTPPSPLKCVHCGHPSPVYPRVSRLIDHLKRTHRYDPRVQKGPPRPTLSRQNTSQSATSNSIAPDLDNDNDSAASGVEADAEEATLTVNEEEKMLGGVHLDGFLQPIVLTGGRGKDKAPRLKRAKTKRSKVERKSAKEARIEASSSTKRKRDLVADEEERLVRGRP